MRKELREQNEQIGALVREVTSQAVDFYNNIEKYPVCRLAEKGTSESLKDMEIREASIRFWVLPRCAGSTICGCTSTALLGLPPCFPINTGKNYRESSFRTA